MRVLGVSVLLASIGLAPQIASAGRHDGPEVRDHRSSDSGHSEPVVRDHRSSDGGHNEPIVRDHRSSDSGQSAPVVRDHRDSGSYDGTVYYASEEPVMVSDGGSPSLFSSTSPSFTFEFGGLARRFRGPAFTRSGSVETTSGDLASYDLASGTPAAGDTTGGAFTMRFTVPMSDHFYAGAELEAGGITRSPIQLMSDSPDIHISSRALVGTGAVAGARMRHGIVELGGELAGGLRIQTMTVQSFDAVDGDPSETETMLSGLVEARVRGAVWVTPHVFLAAQAGTNVFDRSDINVGLSIGLASRAFGAAR
ncbi:MAG: hypothetical protein HOV81_29625 [Kofleriaceae bacterium]|nr:hypothetical protein [Kofleriaceae bacterium]